MQRVTYILIPGLWDQKPLFGWFYAVVGKWWRLHGMHTIVCQMNWVNTEPFTVKRDRLEACISKEQQAGREVVLVGVSAGAPMALLALTRSPHRVKGIVTVSGLLALSARDRKNPLYAKTSWFHAADLAEAQSRRLPPKLRRRILSLSGTHDDVINPGREHISGDHRRQIKGSRHLSTVMKLLIFYPYTIKRFVRQDLH